MNIYTFTVGPGFENWLKQQPDAEPPGEMSFKKNDHFDGSGHPLNEEITITQPEDSTLTDAQWQDVCKAFLIPFIIRYSSQPRKY